MTELMQRSDSMGVALGGQLDAFVCSASFEDRCLSVSEMLVRDAALRGGALIASNGEHIPTVLGNQARLASMFSHSGVCQLNPNDPLATGDVLIRALSDLLPSSGVARSIGFDVTTFTRESLLIALRCLLEVVRPEDSLIGFYNRADSYEGEETGAGEWLSRGVREIRSVVGYPGDFVPTRRTHLVMLAGFEDDRALQLTTELEPSLLSLGSPDPDSGHAHVHDAKMQKRKARWLSHLGCHVNEFLFDGYDVYRCVEAIGLAVKKEQSMNVVLAAMNTKMSTLAAGIYALGNPSVQVSYAQADVYNDKRYSVAASDVYYFDLSDAVRGLLSTRSV